ncbi:hypothetical protein Desku_3471 [Desulfofundulus kuznetsovii DSM 6115]|uniref:Uncharacterized protein n=1 Tax=Desulfofundulus kuznetsovii (strain DSM 6115 / VKM B-1805 / 17) TaxID=760568 RepID=A0AAU8PFP4_DESK7|nr:hypothetical protein Desku_3471 [Desulfofundulus kuznetsovii DSM 6115]
MIIRKREFFIGIVLLISFFVVLAVLMSPVMNGKTVIGYADDLFNELTKGSTYYIPGIMSKAKNFEGQNFQVTLEARDKEEAAKMTGFFTAAGAAVAAQGQKLTVSGDLGKMAQTALTDADAEFNNRGDQIKGRYGLESREVIYYWWNLFDTLQKHYKLEARAGEMSFAGSVLTKALEPAYNFEGIHAAKVADKAGVTTFMLAFYVIYTMWYGFAMMFIFEGLGISASAHGEKAEA